MISSEKSAKMSNQEVDWVEMDGDDGTKRFQVNKVDSSHDQDPANDDDGHDGQDENPDLLSAHYNAASTFWTVNTLLYILNDSMQF